MPVSSERQFPRYPIYIVSKGRADSRFTVKALEKLNIPYYVAIEPQDYDSYSKVIMKDRLLILPFSNHGDGPGRARNWCWEHSISMGFKRHWVMDDNISMFYRLNKNHRVITRTGAIFRAAEDFVDRYENVPISGFQYAMFMPDINKSPPFILNTRIYSCLLIENSCKYRWRGRYNEDTDLSLRVLKDGDCTIEFTAFLQQKIGTQLIKGGNTAEFYNKEGTWNKSKMLVEMHPDVARMVWKYGRWHHYVDYTPFKKNKLRLRPDIDLNAFPKIDEYEMKLINRIGK